MKILNKFSCSLLLIMAVAFACFAAPAAEHARGPSIDIMQKLFPFAAPDLSPIVQPECIQAVYTTVGAVDLGDSATTARISDTTLNGAAYAIEVQYTYIGPRLYDPDPAGTQPISMARGFAGFGANHFARADV